MGLRDLLKKKDKIEVDGPAADGEIYGRLAAPNPNVQFIRSDTFSAEVVHPPDHPELHYQEQQQQQYEQPGQFLSAAEAEAPPSSNPRRSIFSSFGARSRGSSVSSGLDSGGGEKDEDFNKPSAARRLSRRLHLSRAPPSSENVPQDLPEIVLPAEGEAGYDKDGAESQWEKRATMLARENERVLSRPSSSGGGSRARSSTHSGVGGPPVIPTIAPVSPPPTDEFGWLNLSDSGSGRGNGGVAPNGRGRPRSPSAVSSRAVDEDIQEAIRLHEEGQLAESTKLFGRLADPDGPNIPLSQVLYGLALRHGWGCEPDPAGAVFYLSKAASNAAAVENLALQAGMKKGGAAKGELVLAIFELANCFRHGWGIPKDPVAAKQYYETAANLGDTDAMNEVAWCYLEGHGTKKDKFAAAKYYRLAEQNGNKTLGNSWIWKDKYEPGYTGKKK